MRASVLQLRMGLILAGVVLAGAGCGKKEEKVEKPGEKFVVVGKELTLPPPEKSEKSDPESAPVARNSAPPPYEPGDGATSFHISRNLDFVAYSPDGTMLAATSWFGGGRELKVWDPGTGKEKEFKGAKDFGGQVAFTPDSKLLVTAPGKGEETFVRLWDVPANKVLRTFKIGHSHVTGLALSPDAKVLAVSCGDHSIRLIDWASGKGRPPLTGHKDFISALAFSSDGALLASGSHDKTIRLWDVPAGKEKATLAGHTDLVSALAFTSQNQTLVSGTSPGLSGKSDKTLRLWDVAAAKEKSSIALPDTATALVVTPDGATVITANFEKGIYFWDAATGKSKGKVGPLNDMANRLALTRDGKTLAVGHMGGAILTYDLGKPVKVLAERSTLTFPGSVSWIVLAADGGKLAGESWVDEVTVWDVAAGKKLLQRKHLLFKTIAPDLKTALTTPDKSLQLWDLEANKAGLRLKGQTELVAHAAFSPDGKLLATVGLSEKAVNLWDVQTGAERATLKDLESGPNFVVFSADSKRLAAGDGRTVKVWDTLTNQVKHTIDGDFACAAFSADGRRLVLGQKVVLGGGTSTIWDLAANKGILTVGGHGGWMRAVALSPDGKLLATGSSYNTRYGDDLKTLPRDDTEPVLRLWYTATGQPAAILHGHTGDLKCLAFSPDGKTLFSGSEDHTVKLWDLADLSGPSKP